MWDMGRGGQGSWPASGLPPAVRWRPVPRFRGWFGLAQCSSDSPHVQRGRCFLKRIEAVQGALAGRPVPCWATVSGRTSCWCCPSWQFSRGLAVLDLKQHACAGTGGLSDAQAQESKRAISTAVPRAILSSLKMVVLPSLPLAPVKAYEIDHRRRRVERCSDERGEM